VEASLLFLFSLTILINSLGQEVQASNYWFAASNFCGGVGLMLHPLFHEAMPLICVLLANFLLFAELSLLNKAIAEFVGHGRQIWLVFLGMSVAITAASVKLVLWHQNYVLQVDLLSVMTVSTAACSAVLLFRYGAPDIKASTMVMSGLFAVYSVHNMLRFVDVLSHPGYRFYNLWIDRTIIAGLCFGYLLMSSARMRNQLEHMANTDHLTGALNRRAVERAALRLAARRHTRADCISVLMVDVDSFKEINDTHGHHAGDLALKTLADTLRETMRGGDLVARLGGDEFMVVMAGTTMDEAEVAAERVRRKLSHAQLQASTGEFGVRASVGVATVESYDFRLADLVRLGDLALYRVKAESRRKADREAEQLRQELTATDSR
jgi:diguanylate cyclase (GGDEF)-like protein